MAIIKCKMCGGDLVLTEGSTIATCEYCGTQQTVPTIDDDKKARLYNRANQYRMDSEFDKAYAAYESIVNDQPDEAEAYWGMLLSEYGVEYVDDPKTGKMIPTCHRTLMRSVTSSTNYKAACQYADGESRIMYEDDAAVLDTLQKRVLNASAKEEPYDVFICYKETDEAGNRTADSVMAQDIYDALTTKGMRVFFSRISLEDKLGQDYEPCIFAALSSAKVMLMVTTDSDYCNAVWVKNEWKRYLDFMKNDSSKTLIPVYKDISPYTLPDEFANLQAQDMGKLGAIQDLVRGVEKLAGKGNHHGKAGMSEDERKAFHSMQKGQRNTRFIILSVISFLAGFIVLGFAMDKNTKAPIMNWILLQSNEQTIHLGDYFQKHIYLTPAAIALPIIPLVSCISHGVKSAFSRWVFAALYFAICALMCSLQLYGFAVGMAFWAYFAVVGCLATLATLFAYWDNKKKLGFHLLSMFVALALTLIMNVI